VVLESATLSEVELNAYCREKGFVRVADKISLTRSTHQIATSKSSAR